MKQTQNNNYWKKYKLANQTASEAPVGWSLFIYNYKYRSMKPSEKCNQLNGAYRTKALFFLMYNM